MAYDINKPCPHCGGDPKIANPTGNCDHIYYPEYVNKSIKNGKGRWGLWVYRTNEAPEFHPWYEVMFNLFVLGPIFTLYLMGAAAWGRIRRANAKR